MKKILVIRGISAYDVLGRAADEICEGFRKCGYQVDMIGATDPGADDRFIECLEHRDQYAFYFSIQAILWNLESENLPELAEMKRVGWIVDDPVYHQKRIWGSLGTNARLLMVRDSHAADAGGIFKVRAGGDAVSWRISAGGPGTVPQEGHCPVFSGNVQTAAGFREQD